MGFGGAVPVSAWLRVCVVWAGVMFALLEKESWAEPRLLVWDAAPCGRDPQPWGKQG